MDPSSAIVIFRFLFSHTVNTINAQFELWFTITFAVTIAS